MDERGTPQLCSPSISDVNISFPTLAPGVHVFNRDEKTVQIGIDPATSIVADTEVIRALLPVLTGTFSISEIVAHAATFDLDEASVINFLELLQSLTLLINNEPELSSRARNSVNDFQRHNLLRETKSAANVIDRRSLTEIEIQGAGRLGTTICMLLASAGFPSIRVIDPQVTSTSDLTPWGATRLDVGNRRDLVAMQIMERIAKGATSHNNYLRFRSDRKLVILVPDQNSDFPWFNPLLTDSLMADGTPHLFAASATNESHIGPITIPGEVPCTRCNYYRHCDIDPAWQLVSQQLTTSPVRDLASIDLIVRTALATVEKVASWIDSEFIPSTDVQRLFRNKTQIESEHIEFHPKCGCAWDRGIFD